MKNKGDIAKEYFLEGYNCSQAVLLAFAEDYGLNKSTALMLSSSFGGGMGRLREVCGTVSGMFMVLGLEYGYDDPKNIEAKKELYKKIQTLASDFKQDNGSIICRELLGLSQKGASNPIPDQRNDQYYKKRPCKELVEYAANLVDDFIKNNKK